MLEKDIATFRQKLKKWYRNYHRDLPWRRTSDPYLTWVSEVMAQQTQIETVVPYYHRFVGRFPDVVALATAEQEEVLKLWEGMGYYARARNLHKAARLVVAEHGARIPDEWHKIRRLPGIGDYTASAVLSIAFHQPYAVVDGNVKRILARLFLMHYAVNVATYHQHFNCQANRILDQSNPGIFNQAMMELGALICRPRHPQCERCPVDATCRANQEQKTALFPKRKSSPRVPQYEIAAGVIRKDDRLLITKRKPEGLLGGLWEFPGGKIRRDETAREACIREIHEETGLVVKPVDEIAKVRHAYTHFKNRITVFLCDYISGSIQLDGPVAHQWIGLESLCHFAFPKANHKFFPALEKKLKPDLDKKIEKNNQIVV